MRYYWLFLLTSVACEHQTLLDSSGFGEAYDATQAGASFGAVESDEAFNAPDCTDPTQEEDRSVQASFTYRACIESGPVDDGAHAEQEEALLGAVLGSSSPFEEAGVGGAEGGHLHVYNKEACEACLKAAKGTSSQWNTYCSTYEPKSNCRSHQFSTSVERTNYCNNNVCDK